MWLGSFEVDDCLQSQSKEAATGEKQILQKLQRHKIRRLILAQRSSLIVGKKQATGPRLPAVNVPA